MRWCCPRGHGCNAPGTEEPCALDVCRAADPELREAALALERWAALERACEHRRNERELRFRRRAYERARDHALVAVALHGASATPAIAVRRARARERLRDSG